MAGIRKRGTRGNKTQSITVDIATCDQYLKQNRYAEAYIILGLLIENEIVGSSTFVALSEKRQSLVKLMSDELLKKVEKKGISGRGIK